MEDRSESSTRVVEEAWQQSGSSTWSLKSDLDILVGSLAKLSSSIRQDASRAFQALDRAEAALDVASGVKEDASKALNELSDKKFVSFKLKEPTFKSTNASSASAHAGKSAPVDRSSANDGATRRALEASMSVDFLNERPIPYVIGSDAFISDLKTAGLISAQRRNSFTRDERVDGGGAGASPAHSPAAPRPGGGDEGLFLLGRDPQAQPSIEGGAALVVQESSTVFDDSDLFGSGATSFFSTIQVPLPPTPPSPPEPAASSTVAAPIVPKRPEVLKTPLTLLQQQHSAALDSSLDAGETMEDDLFGDDVAPFAQPLPVVTSLGQLPAPPPPPPPPPPPAPTLVQAPPIVTTAAPPPPPRTKPKLFEDDDDDDDDEDLLVYAPPRSKP